MTPDPKYNQLILKMAEPYKGLTEYPGAKHNAQIIQMFENVGHSWVQDDETPWCAAFVGDVLSRCGLQHSGKLNARSYLDWGVEVPSGEERPGDIIVFTRGDPNGPYGHVGFFIRFEGSRALVLGGNQGNQVSEAWYPSGRILSIRRATTTEGATGAERQRPTLRHGDRGIFVSEAQLDLKHHGYNLGTVDSFFGDLTHTAVLNFQRRNNLKVDGVIGPNTWGALKSEDANRAEKRYHMTEGNLRKSSDTIQTADQGEKVIKQGAATTVTLGTLDTGLKAAEKVSSADTVLSGLQQTFLDNVLIIGIITIGVVAWFWGPKIMGAIRGFRVRDAQNGKHIGR